MSKLQCQYLKNIELLPECSLGEDVGGGVEQVVVLVVDPHGQVVLPKVHLHHNNLNNFRLQEYPI